MPSRSYSPDSADSVWKWTLQFTLAVLFDVTRGFQTLAMFLLLVGLRAVMAEGQDRQLLLRADKVLRPLGASGRKRSKLLQCSWEIAERFSIHSTAASCSPAPFVRWARMKEAHEVE
jgi:hypothetical protein